MGLKGKKFLRIFLVMAFVICMFSTTAFATTNSVSIYVYGNQTPVATFTRAQLTDASLFTTIAKHNYSTVDCTVPPVYKYYTAKGPELQEVITKALTGSGYTLSDVGQIDFLASDDYLFSTTRSDLLANRNWYDTNQDLGGATPAILATSAANGLNVADGSLSANNTFRDFYGQEGYEDYTINNFVKNIETITLYVQ